MAPDGGLTVPEIVVDMVITGMIMVSMTLLVLLSIRVFSPQEEAERPERVAARELSRSAERMLVLEQCANPTPDDLGDAFGQGALRSQCLTTAETPFPVPVPHRDSGVRNWYPLDSDVVCWMVEWDSRGETTDDPRDLECWYHRSNPGTAGVMGGDLMVAAHRPVMPSAITADMFVPKDWESVPYRVAVVTDRIESIGSAFHDPSRGYSPNSAKWRCVEGRDPDPESKLDDETEAELLTDPEERDCDAGEFDARDGAGLRTSPGVAALTVDLCVSLSDAELEHRTTEEKKPTTEKPYGQTCAIKTVTVSLGRE